MTIALRQFRVHAQGGGGHHILAEASFEAAAVAFAERWAAPSDEAGVAVVVRDLDTGHEHCFRIDLETGETAPCR